MIWRVLVLSAALSTVAASACTYDPKIDANGFKCNVNGDCPSGYQCAKATGASAGVCCNRSDQTMCLAPATGDAATERGLAGDALVPDAPRTQPDAAAPDMSAARPDLAAESGADAGMLDAPGAALLTVNPPSVNFGTVDVGDSSAAAQVITVTNTGAAAAAIIPTVTSPFTISQTCFSVPANGTCTISMFFTPTAAGPVSGVLSLTGTLAVNLSGSGVPPGNFSVADVNLGQLATNAVVSGAVTVTATGSLTTLACSLSGADLTADPTKVCPAALAAGASCAVGFTFEATTAGQKTDSVVCNAAGVTKTAVVSATVFDPAKLVITPPSVTFQTQNGTQSAPVTFGVANSGGMATGQVSATITGTNANQFAITVPGCLAPLAGAGNCTIQVVCNPTTVGTKTATLTVADASAAADSVTAALTCTSVGPPTLTVTGTANLGTVSVGQSGTALTYTITNSGGSATAALTVAASDAEFAIGSDLCSGLSLAAAKTCTFTVTFVPTSAGVKSAVLSASSGGALPGTLTIQGIGLTVASLTITPPTLDFGSIGVGTVSGTKTFTVTNTGGTATGVLSVVKGDGTSSVGGASQFSYTTTCQAALAPAASCQLVVTFSPTIAGSASATITVTDGAVSSTPHTVVGIAISPPSITIDCGGSSPIAFPETPIGNTSAPVACTVTNGSSSTQATGALVAATTGDYAVGTNNCMASLAPGLSCALSLTFSPTVRGTRDGTITVVGANGGAANVNLTGTGTGPLTVSPAPATFSSVAVGATSNTLTLTVRNAGTVALNGMAFTLTGPNASQFSAVADSLTGSNLPAGGSTTIGVQFIPTTAGAMSATLTVTGTRADNAAVETGTDDLIGNL